MFSKLNLFVIVASILVIFGMLARADEYQRVIITGTTAGSYTNTATFYNAKILAVRAWNLAGAGCTNAIVVKQVDSTGVITNTFPTITTTTSGSVDVSTNFYTQFKNDILSVSATSNFLAEVILVTRCRAECLRARAGYARRGSQFGESHECMDRHNSRGSGTLPGRRLR